jgi:hypothetical protein
MSRWVSVLLHVLVILGGIAGSVKTKNIAPLVASGAVNAAIRSPLTKSEPDKVGPGGNLGGGLSD